MSAFSFRNAFAHGYVSMALAQLWFLKLEFAFLLAIPLFLCYRVLI